jgi:hypothetical protein
LGGYWNVGETVGFCGSEALRFVGREMKEESELVAQRDGTK